MNEGMIAAPRRSPRRLFCPNSVCVVDLLLRPSALVRSCSPMVFVSYDLRYALPFPLCSPCYASNVTRVPARYVSCSLRAVSSQRCVPLSSCIYISLRRSTRWCSGHTGGGRSPTSSPIAASVALVDAGHIFAYVAPLGTRARYHTLCSSDPDID